jgi:hypothetical protein
LDDLQEEEPRKTPRSEGFQETGQPAPVEEELDPPRFVEEEGQSADDNDQNQRFELDVVFSG